MARAAQGTAQSGAAATAAPGAPHGRAGAEQLLQPCHRSPAAATAAATAAPPLPPRSRTDEPPFASPCGGTPVHYRFGIKEPSPSLGKLRHGGARQGRAAGGGSRSLPGKGHQSHHMGAAGGQVAEEGPQNPQEAPAQSPPRIQPEGQRGQKGHGSGDPAGCPCSCPGCHPGEQQGVPVRGGATAGVPARASPSPRGTHPRGVAAVSPRCAGTRALCPGSPPGSCHVPQLVNGRANWSDGAAAPVPSPRPGGPAPVGGVNPPTEEPPMGPGGAQGTPTLRCHLQTGTKPKTAAMSPHHHRCPQAGRGRIRVQAPPRHKAAPGGPRELSIFCTIAPRDSKQPFSKGHRMVLSPPEVPPRLCPPGHTEGARRANRAPPLPHALWPPVPPEAL